MSVSITIRVPEELAKRIDARCSIRQKNKTDVLIEAIERGWAEGAVLQHVSQGLQKNVPISIPGVFLGSQMNKPHDLADTQRLICGKRWWEDGEEYECLMDQGHRFPKHGQHGMVRRIDG